jgi:hypothetical protein
MDVKRLLSYIRRVLAPQAAGGGGCGCVAQLAEPHRSFNYQVMAFLFLGEEGIYRAWAKTCPAQYQSRMNLGSRVARRIIL